MTFCDQTTRHRTTRYFLILCALALILSQVSCVEKSEEPVRTEPSPPPLVLDPYVQPLETGSTEGLAVAAERHLATIEKRLSSKNLSEGAREHLESSRQVTTGILDAIGRGNLNEWLSNTFHFYRAGDPGSILVTGYYTPVIEASRSSDGRFRFPVYGLPPDLVTVNLADFDLSGMIRGRVTNNRLVPYFTRAEITKGVADMPPPLMFVQDPIDLFFLHIQGSGVAVLDDGRRVRLNYAAGNGRPYGSLGRALIEDGKIRAEEMSMEAIRNYFTQHPDEMDGYLARNQSYVFFRMADDGPYGSTGALVTAGRTIAADSSVYPELGVAYLETEIPVGRNQDGSVRTGYYKAIVFHQDAGGAINGQHIDLYYGEGDRAGFLAGHTKTSGTLYYLRPKA